MSIECSCVCGKRYKVDDAMAGRSGKCKACGRIIEIPAAAAESELPDERDLSAAASSSFTDGDAGAGGAAQFANAHAVDPEVATRLRRKLARVPVLAAIVVAALWIVYLVALGGVDLLSPGKAPTATTYRIDLVFAILGTIGAGPMALRTTRRTRTLLKCGVQTEARLISPAGDIPVFAFAVNGKRHTRECPTGPGGWSFDETSRVPVIYNPADPAEYEMLLSLGAHREGLGESLRTDAKHALFKPLVVVLAVGNCLAVGFVWRLCAGNDFDLKTNTLPILLAGVGLVTIELLAWDMRQRTVSSMNKRLRFMMGGVAAVFLLAAIGYAWSNQGVQTAQKRSERQSDAEKAERARTDPRVTDEQLQKFQEMKTRRATRPGR